MDNLTAFTGIETRQIRSLGPETIISGAFLIYDLIFTSTSKGQVSILATDGEYTHVVAVMHGPGVFNHAFAHGWPFWKGAELVVAKELADGQVDVSVGFTKIPSAPTYDQWKRRSGTVNIRGR